MSNKITFTDDAKADLQKAYNQPISKYTIKNITARIIILKKSWKPLKLLSTSLEGK